MGPIIVRIPANLTVAYAPVRDAKCPHPFRRNVHMLPGATVHIYPGEVSTWVWRLHYDSRLKLWMQHFHGVATKYLKSYLGWMRLLDREKELPPERLLGILARRVWFANL